MQALLMDTLERFSIHDRVDCPARLDGLARHFVRAGLGFGQGGLAIYEEEPYATEPYSKWMTRLHRSQKRRMHLRQRLHPHWQSPSRLMR
jgi:hypothetical protein